CCFQGALYCLGPGISVVHFFVEIARGDPVQFLGELSLVRVIVIGARDVDKAPGLFRDDLGDIRIGVSESRDRNTRVEIEEYVSVDVRDHRAVSPLHHKGITARITRRYISRVERQELLSFGTWQFGYNSWELHLLQYRLHA